MGIPGPLVSVRTLLLAGAYRWAEKVVAKPQKGRSVVAAILSCRGATHVMDHHASFRSY